MTTTSTPTASEADARTLVIGTPVTASQPGCPSFLGTYAGPAEGMGPEWVGVTHERGTARVHYSRVSAL